jgi:hypothetical protein
MMERQIARPTLIPLDFAVKNGSKTRSMLRVNLVVTHR